MLYHCIVITIFVIQYMWWYWLSINFWIIILLLLITSLVINNNDGGIMIHYLLNHYWWHLVMIYILNDLPLMIQTYDVTINLHLLTSFLNPILWPDRLSFSPFIYWHYWQFSLSQIMWAACCFLDSNYLSLVCWVIITFSAIWSSSLLHYCITSLPSFSFPHFAYYFRNYAIDNTLLIHFKVPGSWGACGWSDVNRI